MKITNNCGKRPLCKKIIRKIDRSFHMKKKVRLIGKKVRLNKYSFYQHVSNILESILCKIKLFSLFYILHFYQIFIPWRRVRNFLWCSRLLGLYCCSTLNASTKSQVKSYCTSKLKRDSEQSFMKFSLPRLRDVTNDLRRMRTQRG